MQLDEGWLEDERDEFLEELNLEVLEEQHNDAMPCTAKELEQVGQRFELRHLKGCWVFFFIRNRKWSKKQNQRV